MSKLDEMLGIDRNDPEEARALQLAEMHEKLIDDLIEIRKQRGLSQQDVARRMHRDQSTVSNFERLSSDPRLSTIRRYALAVGADLSFEVSNSWHSSAHDKAIDVRVAPARSTSDRGSWSEKWVNN